MTDERHPIDSQIEIAFDIKKSFFLVKDKRDKNRVFDAIVGFFTRPHETIVIPNLFSKNYPYGCLSSGRDIVGYLVSENKIIYSKDKQLIEMELNDSKKAIESSEIFEKCCGTARLMYCDIPNFGKDTKLMFNVDEYLDFIDKIVTFYMNIIEKCLQVGGQVVFVSQNIVTTSRGDILPLTYDVMAKLRKFDNIVFRGDRIWGYQDGGKNSSNRSNVYNCNHKTILFFEKVK